MAWSMSSEHLQLLIAGYVLGDLDPEEAAEFEQLLIDHPEILEEVERTQKALELTYAPSEVSPPARLRSTLMAAPVAQTSPQHHRRSGRSFSWNRAWNVAAAVVIVALGINNYRLWRSLQTSQTEVQRLNNLTYALQGKQAAAAASATVTVNPDELEGLLTVKNLPPLPPGKVYVLWTVLQQNAPFTTDDKDAILTQVFTVDAQGNASQPITVPQVYRTRDLVTKVAVTVEDAASPQKHEGAPVLITGL